MTCWAEAYHMYLCASKARQIALTCLRIALNNSIDHTAQGVSSCRSVVQIKFCRQTAADPSAWPARSVLRIFTPRGENCAKIGDRKRKVYYDEVQPIMSDQQPMTYTTTQFIFVCARENLGNLKPTVSRHRTLWNADELYWN